MKTVTVKAMVADLILSIHETELNLVFNGIYKDMVDNAGITTNGPIEIKISNVNKSKTEKQNNTFHELLSLYWQSGIPSDQSFDDLKIRIKDTYGIHHEIHYINGEAWKVLKSWSKYTLRESRQAIDGLIGEMIQQFAEGCHTNRKFSEMLVQWNNYKLACSNEAD